MRSVLLNLVLRKPCLDDTLQLLNDHILHLSHFILNGIHIQFEKKNLIVEDVANVFTSETRVPLGVIWFEIFVKLIILIFEKIVLFLFKFQRWQFVSAFHQQHIGSLDFALNLFFELLDIDIAMNKVTLA